MSADSLRDAVAALAGRHVVVLTGAGISTDSGIPDYRGPGSPRRTPMTFAEFRSGGAARQRYWARSHLGWQHIAQAQPNAGHRALARMQAVGQVSTIITQNVDGLHQRAGSTPVIDLHGRLDRVICLDCRETTDRRTLHARLGALNPEFASTPNAVVAPDGDVQLERVAGFRVAACSACEGTLKPDVVFFGENVPRDRVGECVALVDRAEALLVAGSSLAVLSGFRFARQAHRRGIPLVIITRGPTRADDLATVKINAGCSETLGQLEKSLAPPRAMRDEASVVV